MRLPPAVETAREHICTRWSHLSQRPSWSDGFLDVAPGSRNAAINPEFRRPVLDPCKRQSNAPVAHAEARVSSYKSPYSAMNADAVSRN